MRTAVSQFDTLAPEPHDAQQFVKAIQSKWGFAPSFVTSLIVKMDLPGGALWTGYVYEYQLQGHPDVRKIYCIPGSHGPVVFADADGVTDAATAAHRYHDHLRSLGRAKSAQS